MRFWIIALLALTGCASSPVFTNAQYEGTDFDSPEHLRDGLDEYDSHRLISLALDSLNKCPEVRRLQVVLLTRLDNQTSEALDGEQLTRQINDELSSAGYRLIDKASRSDLEAEYGYSTSGLVDKTTAIPKGLQRGTTTLLRASITSWTQELTNEKTVRYRLSIQGVDERSALVTCTGSGEIKKRFHRTRVAF